MSTLPTIQSRDTAVSYTWGEVCLGWRFQDTPDLSVIEEVVPPGAGEVRHRHAQARQFFYVLEGEATMEFADGERTFGAGEGLEVPPGVAHRFANRSSQPVRFLVVSAPNTRGDRMDLPA
jgi:mannose-6-phosphate isomerase-like protein (cupin superfamily)